ncbi:uncharacterized protein LOC124255100 isoform X2 [Haliotis rubra]|nr:uncharacterized protein LOC124255100 isoform X2 [Haliotis rubra]
MALACFFLLLYLCLKCKDKCHGCSRFASAFPSDIATFYRQNSWVDCDHEYERISLQDRSREKDTVCSSLQPHHEARPGGEKGEDYIDPRASSSTEHVVDDVRISRLSHLLRTSFWSKTNSEEVLESDHIPTCGSSGQRRTRSCRKVKSTDICSNTLTAGHFIPDSGEIRARGLPSGTAETMPDVTDSMVDIFQEIFNPSNNTLRSLLLRTIHPATEKNKSLSKRLSKSETDVTIAKTFRSFGNTDYDPSTDPQIQSGDDDHYVAVSDIRVTPIPKRRKSLSRKKHILDDKQTENESELRKLPGRSLIKYITIPMFEERREASMPVPRSKPMSPRQCQPSSIFKTSSDKKGGGESPTNRMIEEHVQAPAMHLDTYENEILSGVGSQENPQSFHGSFRRSVQKARNATCLDGQAKTGKEYSNVRMVVKNLSCSIENI